MNLEMFSLLSQNENIAIVAKFLYYSSIIWIPALIIYVLWDLWVMYRRALFFAKQTYVLLEIKVPKDVYKNPQAMEFFLASMYNTLGESNWYEKYWKGQVRAWVSLEIVSIEGEVHFFIWARSGARNQIETNLYSQYPGIEIHEVPDYTLPIQFDPEKIGLWATEFDLTEKDFFPIKTYIDYGLEKDPKEEYKIDPLTPLIEAMGSLGRGNQAWLQIIIRAHKKEDRDPKTGEATDLKWKNGAKKAIEEIMGKAKGEKGEDGKILPGTTRFLTETETATIKSIERSISKNGYDTGMRLIYLGEKDVFSMNNVGGLVGGVMHFNSPLNGFKPARGSAPKHKNMFLAWKDRSEKRIFQEKQEMLDAYKRRAYFHKPFKRPHFVLNTEELATIFHFPGGVSQTPTFSRIDSRKSEAPPNIPV